MAGAAGLIGARKWGQPCYRHAGRPVAVVGTFRSDFRLTFFNAALMGDPEGLLQGQGRNTRHADSLRFTDNTAALAREPVIRACLT